MLLILENEFLLHRTPDVERLAAYFVKRSRDSATCRHSATPRSCARKCDSSPSPRRDGLSATHARTIFFAGPAATETGVLKNTRSCWQWELQWGTAVCVHTGWFNMHNGPFESEKELGSWPKIVVVLDGPPSHALARLGERRSMSSMCSRSHSIRVRPARVILNQDHMVILVRN